MDNLKGNLANIFAINIMLKVGFWQMFLIKTRTFSSVAALLRVFNYELVVVWGEVAQMLSSASTEIIR